MMLAGSLARGVPSTRFARANFQVAFTPLGCRSLSMEVRSSNALVKVLR